MIKRCGKARETWLEDDSWVVVKSFISWWWDFQFTTKKTFNIFSSLAHRSLSSPHASSPLIYAVPVFRSTIWFFHSMRCNGNDSLVEAIGNRFTFNFTRIGVGFSLHFSVPKTWKVRPSSRPTNYKFKWLLSLFTLLSMRLPDQEKCINWACDGKSRRWDGKFRKIQVFRVRRKSEKKSFEPHLYRRYQLSIGRFLFVLWHQSRNSGGACGIFVVVQDYRISRFSCKKNFRLDEGDFFALIFISESPDSGESS